MNRQSSYHILSINPGSTSLKIALYQNEQVLFHAQLPHSGRSPHSPGEITALCNEQASLVLDELQKRGYPPSVLSAVVGRGGLLPPVKTGGYQVSKELTDWLIHDAPIYHASNLGALIADVIAQQQRIPAYIYDCVSSDEMVPFARVTGFPELTRRSFCHVLNARAAARIAAGRLNMRYEDLSAVVAHLGGGISISAHDHGKMIDVIPDDSFHFSPERAGGAPLSAFLDLCFSGLAKTELIQKQRGNAGMAAHLGTADCLEVETRIAAGDGQARLVYEAMAYWVSKGIASLCAAMEGRQQAVVLTGALAQSDLFTGWIRKRVDFLAPVLIVAGENEMEALALGALRILRGEERAETFILP